MVKYVSQPAPHTTLWPHIAATTAMNSVGKVQGDVRLTDNGPEVNLLVQAEVSIIG